MPKVPAPTSITQIPSCHTAGLAALVPALLLFLFTLPGVAQEPVEQNFQARIPMGVYKLTLAFSGRSDCRPLPAGC